MPIPPSSNNLFRNAHGKGRVKTDEYRRWQMYAKSFIPGWTPITGPYRIAIEAPLNRQRDIGNIEKPIVDLLVAVGVVPDDRWCDEIVIRRCQPAGVAEDQVRVEIRAL